MADDNFAEMKRGNLRLVGVVLLLSGLAFIVAAVVIFAFQQDAFGEATTLIAAVLLIIGVSDLIFALFVFRKFSTSNIYSARNAAGNSPDINRV